MEYLADKPRILITHQLQFLSTASQILVLKQVIISEIHGSLSFSHNTLLSPHFKLLECHLCFHSSAKQFCFDLKIAVFLEPSYIV